MATDLRITTFSMGKNWKTLDRQKYHKSHNLQVTTKPYFASMPNVQITTSVGDGRSVEPLQQNSNVRVYPNIVRRLFCRPTTLGHRCDE
jgi:hypothetical protein